MIEWLVGGAAMVVAATLAKSAWSDANAEASPEVDRERLMNEGWGLAQVYWEKSDATFLEGRERSFGPISLTLDAFGSKVVFEYYVVGQMNHAHMHRRKGGEDFSREQQQACCDAAQLSAARQFGAETRRIVLRYIEEQGQRREREAVANRALLEEDGVVCKSINERAELFERDLKSKAEAVRKASGPHRLDALDDVSRFTASCVAVVKSLGMGGRPEREDAARYAASRMEYARSSLIEQLAVEAREASRLAHVGRLAKGIDLRPASAISDIVFGTDVETGEDIELPLAEIPHLIAAGASGSGKSVFLHQLVYQLVHHDHVEQVIIVDLKGGVEFDRYREYANVRVVWDFAEVMSVAEDLVQLMEQRQTVMRENRWQNWRGKRIFFVADEYAEIQNDIDDARADKALKTAAVRLEGNLVRLARRARALGIVFICAMQKATTDAVDSSVRGNLSLRICFRAASREAAAALNDDWEDAPQHPQRLKVGRFLYFDASKGGKIRHMQTHIAPGVEVARDE